MFGGTACPNTEELEECKELATCVGSQTTGTPFPTAPPMTADLLSLPPPGTEDANSPTIVFRASELAAEIFATEAQLSSLQLDGLVGDLRAAAKSGEPAFSVSADAVGVAIKGVAVEKAGQINSTSGVSLLFLFSQRRAFTRLALSDFDAEGGDVGELVGRDEIAASVNATVIRLTAADNPLSTDGTGWKVWELRALSGSFGLLVFEIRRDAALPPTPAIVDDLVGLTQTVETLTTDPLVSDDAIDTPSPSSDATTIIVAVSVTVIVLVLLVIGVLILRRRRRASHQEIPRPRQDSISDYAPVSLVRTSYDSVPAAESLAPPGYVVGPVGRPTQYQPVPGHSQLAYSNVPYE